MVQLLKDLTDSLLQSVKYKKTPKSTLSVKLGVNFITYWLSNRLAERQGFEPRVPRSTTVFKTAAIDHSATSPKTSLSRSAFLLKRCKSTILFWYHKYFSTKILFLRYFIIAAQLTQPYAWNNPYVYFVK